MATKNPCATCGKSFKSVAHAAHRNGSHEFVPTEFRNPRSGAGKASRFAQDVEDAGGTEWRKSQMSYSAFTGYDSVTTSVHGLTFHLVWNGAQFVYGHSTVTDDRTGNTRKVRNVREALRIMDERCREVLKAQGR